MIDYSGSQSVGQSLSSFGAGTREWVIIWLDICQIRSKALQQTHRHGANEWHGNHQSISRGRRWLVPLSPLQVMLLLDFAGRLIQFACFAVESVLERLGLESLPCGAHETLVMWGFCSCFSHTIFHSFCAIS